MWKQQWNIVFADIWKMTLASFAASNYATGGDVTFTISFVFYFSFCNFCCYLCVSDKLLYFCTGRNIVVLPACSDWLKDIHIALLYYFILMILLPNAGQITALVCISFVLQNILFCMYVSMCVLCQAAGVVTLLRFW